MAKISRFTALTKWAVSSLRDHSLKDEAFAAIYKKRSGDEFTPLRAKVFAAGTISGFLVGLEIGFPLGAGITALVFVLINQLG